MRNAGDRTGPGVLRGYAHLSKQESATMIIDTHVHFYDPRRPQGIPWPPADNALLYRTVLPEHCREVAGPQGVTGVVVVEASPWVEDNQWILDLAAAEKLIVGFVGNLNPESETFEAALDRFSRNPLFRGIRIGGGRNVAKIESGVLTPKLKMLARRDITLDLLVRKEELPAASLLAGLIPDLRIVINHVAHVHINGSAPDPEWTRGILALGPCPNVFCKVSALAEMAEEQPAPGSLPYYEPTLDILWEAFGPNRLLYGSNWPVCERAANYAAMFRIVDEYFSGKGEAAKEKAFYTNSRTAYKWVEREESLQGGTARGARGERHDGMRE